jgi:type IV pilus assembly protein PilM
MASVSISWGIELGSGAIKALKLGVRPDGTVEVLDFIVIPHKKVLSSPDMDPDDAMRVAVGQLASQYDLSGAPIAISVPGNQSFARFAKLPPVEPKQVQGVVRFEAGQQIPFDLNEVEWDYQTFVSPDSPEVEVGIFAITKQRIERELGLLRDVGLDPDTVTVGPVATYNAMAYDLQFTESTPGTVILDIGTAHTDLIVADAGRVWIRTFPIGGHHFTEALVEKFKLSYAKADRLKREAERSKHARHVFQAMRGVFADLAQETQRSLGFYKSMHPTADIKRVIGVGSTFRLPGLRRFLKQQLQLDVYRLDEFKRVGLDGPRAGELGAVTLELAVAYGLALQGLGMQTIDANLMPVSLVRETVWRKKTKWFGIAAALGLTAGAAMFIRWAIDNAEVQGSQEPPIIQTAIREADRLRAEAEESGVIGEAAIDPAAIELLDLPDTRAIYSYVVTDLSEMLAAADARTGDGSAFRLRSFQTRFVPASGGGGEDLGGDGGGREGGRGWGPAPSPKSDPYPSHPTLDVVMDVELTEPQPDDFLIKTITPWLKEHADRDGVPYVIIAEDELDYSSMDVGGGRPAQPAFAVPRGRTSRPAAPSGGGGHGAPGGEVETFETEVSGERGFGGGERRPGAQPAGQSSPALDQAAPIIEPEEPAGTAEPSLFQVRYRLALVPLAERSRPGAEGESAEGEAVEDEEGGS